MSVRTLSPDDVDTLNEKRCFLVFEGEDGQGPAARAAAAPLAAANADIPFFYADGNLGSRVKDFVGLPEGAETRIAVIGVKEKKHYVYAGKVAEAELRAWLSDVKSGAAKPFRKSAPRPPKDLDPEHPEMYQLTADSFRELVVDSKVEVFVDLWAEWCGPCVAVGPTLALLAKVLADVPTIKVGKLNVDENATEADFFPEPHIPNMKFFSNKDKQKPIKYAGNRTLVDFIEFLHTHAATPFDLGAYKARAQKLQALAAPLKKAEKAVKRAEEHLSRHRAALSAPQASSLEHALGTLRAELGKGWEASEGNLGALTASLNANSAWEVLEAEERKHVEAEERKALKRVTKVHSDAEYDALVAAAQHDGKAVIVDCFATWCGPCVYIGPIFAALSEKYTNVRFVKIDVDEQRDTAAALGITAMPTFKVLKAGKVVDELVGADPKGLEALCQKYN